MWQARRDLGIEYKDATPEALRDYIYQVNINRYTDPLGPTWDYLVEKNTVNGITNYNAIIESSTRPNPDVNKLLGGFTNWLKTTGNKYIP